MKSKQSPAQARRNAAAAAKEATRKAQADAYAIQVAAAREADKLRSLLTAAQTVTRPAPVDAKAKAKAAFQTRLAKSSKAVMAELTGQKG